MTSADDEPLAGQTGGPLESDESRLEKDSNSGQKDSIAALSDKVTTSYNFRTFIDTKEIYWYDSELGIYRSSGESIIETFVESTKPNISTYEVNEIINHVKRRTLTPRSRFNSQIEWLTLKNCVVNLQTLEIRPFSPEFMATIRIPVSYCNENGIMNDFYEWVKDPIVANPYPAIDKFMHEVMTPEDVETVLDFIAYCLWRSFPFHRYPLFNGSGRNGKGVMLEIIKCFLGHNNVSGESFTVYWEQGLLQLNYMAS